MALHKTPEYLGTQPVAAVAQIGDVKEVLIKWDASATALTNGDFIQLMKVPANAVISNVRVASSATTGSGTVAVGIADAEATTALSKTFVAAAAITTAAVSSADRTVFTDAPSASNDRILAAAIAGANITSPTLYFAVTYRAARYGQ